MSGIEIDWLPLGSVVILRDLDLPAMVHGRFQRELESDQVYEYVGCLYPVGSTDGKSGILFNGDSVLHEVFPGYRDQAELAFVGKLSEVAGDRGRGGEDIG